MPSASRKFRISSVISKYSTIDGFPSSRHSTPTFSSGLAFATTLLPDVQFAAIVAPIKQGSAILCKTLSTANTFSHSMFCSFSTFNRPACCMDENQPPFPFGETAILLFVSSRIFPSLSTTGAISCTKKCIEDSG